MSAQILIQDIVDNFNKQEQLYLIIAELAAKQLGVLEHGDWLDKPDKLNDILEKRKNLVAEINVLNANNQSLQSEVKKQLEITDFVLSALEPQLEEKQYQLLSQSVVDLGDLLAEISRVDQQSHLLIKRKAGFSKTEVPTNSQQVKNAYQEAMQQAKKPGK